MKNDLTINNIREAGFKKSEREAKTYPDFCGRMYRMFSAYPIKVAVRLKLPPELFTVFFALSIITAVFFLSKGTYLFGILGAIFLFLGRAVFDYMDGGIAKFLHHFRNYKYTLYGKYNDYIIHYMIEPLIFVSLLYSAGYFVLGLVVFICYILVHTLRLECNKLEAKKAVNSKKVKVQRKVGKTRILFESLFIYPTSVVEQIVLVGAIFDALSYVALFLATVIIVRLPLFVIIFYRKLLKLDFPR